MCTDKNIGKMNANHDTDVENQNWDGNKGETIHIALVMKRNS